MKTPAQTIDARNARGAHELKEEIRALKEEISRRKFNMQLAVETFEGLAKAHWGKDREAFTLAANKFGESNK